jgi:hypothetical protein
MSAHYKAGKVLLTVKNRKSILDFRFTPELNSGLDYCLRRKRAQQKNQKS